MEKRCILITISHMKFLHRNYRLYFACLLLANVFVSCNDSSSSKESPATDSTSYEKGTYAYDADFLKKHTAKVLELSSADGSGKILLSADYQGRVMTSTATGDSGLSFGWLNYDLISSAEKKKQFNPVGGEERFWLGPEGGQYSVYFKKGDSFNINYWQVPTVIDTVTYDVVQSNNNEAVFAKKASITNYSGTMFELNIERKIRMLDKQAIESKLKAVLPADIRFVGYQTENRLQNVGSADWTRDK